MLAYNRTWKFNGYFLCSKFLAIYTYLDLLNKPLEPTNLCLHSVNHCRKSFGLIASTVFQDWKQVDPVGCIAQKKPVTKVSMSMSQFSTIIDVTFDKILEPCSTLKEQVEIVNSSEVPLVIGDHNMLEAWEGMSPWETWLCCCFKCGVFVFGCHVDLS